MGVSTAKGTDSGARIEDELPDLSKLLQRAWQLRRQVFSLVVVFTVMIFATVFWVKCQYSSEGFLRAPRKFAEYNAHKAALWDGETLRGYLRANKKLDDQNGRYLLDALNERFVQSHLKAVQALSKDDLRYIADAKGAPEAAGILGFSISFSDGSPENAQARVELMGNYVKDTMLSEDLRDAIYIKAGETKAKKQLIDNQIIQKRLALEQAVSRLGAARAIANRYPEASKMESRQLLSTGNDKDSSRYLSPMAQLVGAETEIADLKSQLALLERDAEQNALRSEFYGRIERRSKQVETGKALLAEFVGIGQSVFKDQTLADDKTREVYNQIMLVAEHMQNKHVTEARFVSGPTLPENRSGPTPLILALLSLIAGTVLAITLVLLFDTARAPDVRDGGDEAAPADEGAPEDNLRPARTA
ncbi:hypothetical protein LMG19087_02276 [Ralstonia wenshanensis]|uniref:hypothetical protein n=1 Tax=Ralstonia wenshanensis TaxID=2842456 RepID=UPI0028F4F17F|nr:hypothetical protein [Ralstonia wenshanensis]CAJ0814987.1 hypothetical protein LMG19087_02276 [Ralstonia wenshanensis]